MEEHATGIVLRTQPLTDTSLIVHWLTRSAGRMQTVARGARRPKSPFHGRVDFGYVARFSFQRSRRSQLHALREIHLIEYHAPLRQSLDRLRRAAYCARLVELGTETETDLAETHDLFLGLLGALVAESEARPQTILAFEARLLRQLGLDPTAAAGRLVPGSRQLLRALVEFDWIRLPALRLSPAQTEEIGRLLASILQAHLSRLPPGREEALGAHSNP